MRIATVQALAVRPVGAPAPLAVAQVKALAGIGLEGDAHADARSPRHLLLAGAEAYAALALPPHALRENLLADIDTAGLASGTVLQIGGDVLVRVMFQCEACGRLDLRRPGLARAIGARRGILARVLAGGLIAPGDAVRDLGRLLPAWSDDWRERVAQVLAAVPDGAVVDYALLARLAGVSTSYCRAFPRVIASLGLPRSARALPARTPTACLRWTGEGLFDPPPA